METRLDDGQVLRFGTLGSWTDNKKVTLYGGKASYELTGDDTAAFRTVAADITAALDLNGQHLDLGDKFISVAGSLTICDSSEDHNGSIIASKPDGTKPPVQVAEGGTCTVEQDSIIIEPEMPDRGSATEGEQVTEQKNEQGSEQHPEQGNGQDPAQEP